MQTVEPPGKQQNMRATELRRAPESLQRRPHSLRQALPDLRAAVLYFQDWNNSE